MNNEKQLTLDKIKPNQDYIIHKVSRESIYNRLNQLGLRLNFTIKLIRKAPIFGDPLLFSVENTQIALTKEEASSIIVKIK